MKDNIGAFFNQLINYPWLMMAMSVLLSAIWILIAMNEPLLSLSENQNLYIYSTQAQVLSAVYGLTLTGYIFLRNHQEREIDRDNSLIEIIRTIQAKEYTFLIMLTIVSITAILLDLMTLSLFLSEKKILSIITKNCATVFFMNGLLLITYFILKALKADKYSEVSKEIILDAEKNIRDYLGNESTLEDVQEEDKNNEHILYGKFMTGFIDLENKLFNLYEIYNSKTKVPSLDLIHSNARMTISRVLKELSGSRRIPQALVPEIYALVKYRNALVHTTSVEPSQNMVSNVERINNEIDNILKKYEAERQ